jgi:hypothetical protein
MGLKSRIEDVTFFTWSDGTATPGVDRRYAHWGKLRLSDKNAPRLPEPNNLYSEEYCAIGNASQAYGTGWGWSDTQCNGTFTSICKIPRGWR